METGKPETGKPVLDFMDDIAEDTSKSGFELWIAEKTSKCKGLNRFIRAVAKAEKGGNKCQG